MDDKIIQLLIKELSAELSINITLTEKVKSLH
jgi:hypothetical protein